MNEYVVERSRRDNIKQLLLILLGDLLVGLFIFLPKESFTDVGILFTIGRVLSYIISPVLLFVTVVAIKEVNNTQPYMVIREDGLIQNMTKYQSGLIRWDDIEAVKLRAVIGDGIYMISILLKNPEKYIKDKKLLLRLKARREKNPDEGEITIVTNGFKSVAKEAITTMLRRMREYNEGKAQ